MPPNLELLQIDTHIPDRLMHMVASVLLRIKRPGAQSPEGLAYIALTGITMQKRKGKQGVAVA